MKKVFLFFSLILLPVVILTSLFRLKMGMKIEEIAEQSEEEPVFIENGVSVF